MGGGEVPAGVSEAFRRLAEYLADVPDRAGVSSYVVGMEGAITESLPARCSMDCKGHSTERRRRSAAQLQEGVTIWPFKRKEPVETRAMATGYTSQIMAAREVWIAGRSGIGELTATVQACVGLWEAALSAADVTGTDIC